MIIFLSGDLGGSKPCGLALCSHTRSKLLRVALIFEPALRALGSLPDSDIQIKRPPIW
jgi:hypothetical protein